MLHRDVVQAYDPKEFSYTLMLFEDIWIHLQDFIKKCFKMANVLFSARTNVMGFDGVALTNKWLLFPCNSPGNIYSLPFVSVLISPYSVLRWAEYSSCFSLFLVL